MSRVIGVIPARWGSTRFEGKPITPICGKPMIQHVWDSARRCQYLNDVVVACDDGRIKNKTHAFGAKTVITKKEHASGTDRIAEVIRNMDCEVVVNIQGDEPLMDAPTIDRLAKELLDNPTVKMGTVIKRLDSEDELDDPNIVKVVIDRNRDALYFSRAPIPFKRDEAKERIECYKHLGLYAYRKEFLLWLAEFPPTRLEQEEQLEQLRVLEAGFKIRTIETHTKTIGVDTPEDVAKVEAILKA